MGIKSDFFEEMSSRVLSAHLQPVNYSEVANFTPEQEDIEIFDCQTGEKVGLCEVKSQLDEKSQSLEAAIQKHGRITEVMTSQEGIWDVRVKKTFQLSKSIKKMESVVDYAMTNQVNLDVRLHSTNADKNVLSVMAANEIVSVKKIGNAHPAKVAIHAQSEAYLIPEQVQGLNKWIRDNSEKWKNSLDRLRVSKLPQRHLFIWISDATPISIREPALFDPCLLPTECPTNLEFITHLWIGISISQEGTCHCWLFECGVGWKLVVMDKLQLPKDKGQS